MPFQNDRESALSLEGKRIARRKPGARKTRFRRYFLYGGALLLFIALLLPFHEFQSDRYRLLARHFLRRMYDREIEIGKASFNVLGWVTLEDVKVHNPSGYRAPLLLYAPRIRMRFGMTGGDTSAFRPKTVTLTEPEFWFERGDTLPWNTTHLWVEKKERAPLPTFQLPFLVRKATIHFSDARVGDSGFRTVFAPVDISYTVFSNGAEIRTLMNARGVPLSRGGTFDFLLAVRPARRRAELTLLFHNAEITQMAPYYSFLKLLRIESGRVEAVHRMTFDRRRIRTSGSVQFRSATIRHRFTNQVFTEVRPAVTYTFRYGDTEVVIDTGTVLWKRSRIRFSGRTSRRYSDTSFLSLDFRTENARVEDIGFLLSTPAFSGTGPVEARCLLEQASSARKRPAPVLLRAAVVLDAASACYGDVVRKNPGDTGRISIDGIAGRRPDRIDVTLGNAEAVALSAEKKAWKVVLRKEEGSEILKHLAFQDLLPDTAFAGPVTMDFTIDSSGDLAGRIDLTTARIALPPFLIKPPKTTLVVSLHAALRPDSISFHNTAITISRSILTIAGNITPRRHWFDIYCDYLALSDLRTLSPIVRSFFGRRLFLSGEAMGRFLVSRSFVPETTPLSVLVDLDLLRSDIRLHGIGRKRPGIRFEFSGLLMGEDKNWDLQDGALRLDDSSLSLTARFGRGQKTVSFQSRQTGLNGFRGFLASRLCPALAKIEAQGTGNLSGLFEAADTRWRFSLELDAARARFRFGDTWIKRTGEPFAAQVRIHSAGDSIVIDKVAARHNSTALLFTGSFLRQERIHPLAGTLELDLFLPELRRSAPGLLRARTGRRSVAQALRLVEDKNHRAHLYWFVSGTLERPKLILDKQRVLSEAGRGTLLSPLSRMSHLLFSPFQAGAHIVSDISNSLSPE
ncbi:MAG: DUF748 domain-containing protein [Candidatus Hydrogenedentota bacterium]|nr:MAG: DUF748 domain-containing protein [Candidatus Hydrogenedentota bacterium]